MKKFISIATVLIALIISTVASAGSWQRPVDVEPSVTFGQPVVGGISNSVKYVTPSRWPVSAPTDGVLVRSFGLLQTYKSSSGYYWEVFGVFNMAPPAKVAAGDYLGYVNGTTLYLLVSGTLPPFVNNRYTPTYVRPVGCCLGIDYYNAETM